jgi:NAD(P)-dependent dehydrogenase (short-subunit alcohol dehydrogenase family)
MKLQRGITAVVTGAANGIGRATSEALARQGCAIALVDIDERALKDTATRMLTAGHCVSSYVADVTDRQRISDLAREIAAQHETAEILINSAGVALSGRFEQLQLDDIAWLFEVNFWGVVYCSHCFLPLLKKAREAALVNVLSTLALVAAPGKSAYCASKFAVRGLSESLGMELARSSVRVTNVYPGPVSTGIVRAGRAVGRKHSGGKRSFLPTEGWRPRSSRRRFSQPSSAARAA